MNNLLNNDFLKIEMQILEMETRLPSFKAKIHTTIDHPTGKFSYSADNIWFDCRTWDNFIKQIKSIQISGSIILISMSEQFVLKLSNNEIKILIKEVSFGGLTIELNYSQEIAREDIFNLQVGFSKFDFEYLKNS